jgi:3-oxoadipate enol-lactonase
MKLAFEEHGQGKPIVLLHAFPLSRKMWKPQIDALAAANCRVILPDFRGFGETELVSETTTMEDLANDVAGLLDSLQIDKAIIGGLSMGGYVTLNLYRLHPDKFGGMILADTSSLADTPEKREGRFDLIEKTETKGMQAVIDEMLPKLTSDYTRSNNPDLIRHLESSFLQTDPKSSNAAMRGMAERQDHTKMLEQIVVPTLLIFGEEDKVTNLEAAKVLNSNIPHSNLVIIEKIGHYSNYENTEVFNKTLVDFVKRVNF